MLLRLLKWLREQIDRMIDYLDPPVYTWSRGDDE